MEERRGRRGSSFFYYLVREIVEECIGEGDNPLTGEDDPSYKGMNGMDLFNPFDKDRGSG